MHWLDFLRRAKNMQQAFSNPENARIWLAAQPQADPVQMQGILLYQIEALDGSTLPPAEILPLLNILKSAATSVQATLEPRYLRKPLPMASVDQRIFETARQLWTRLGIAYLRIAPHFAPADRLLPLHRAASSIRLAEYCHPQAAQECSALLDRLLFAILEQAGTSQPAAPASCRSRLSLSRGIEHCRPRRLGFFTTSNRTLSSLVTSVGSCQSCHQPLA
ncbi:MAG: hypothetical protein IPJ38_21195 [Dechloromonas sp.]|uniref:Uncharacterized protein n=1 Tax=Candidatus Dechloromonas phosphorivorans TaxID=2899244 RepID=A0A935K5Y6_9RHOO|nr:hypothetical protein [Candidatus Dechloromonas phosphorivorans]